VFAAKADSAAVISGFLAERFERKGLKMKVMEWMGV
jgi:hypothetical protein